MKIRPYVEKLEQSEDFKNFKVKYPEAFMVAGFFVLDLEAGMNIHQIDFYIPGEKKIAAFTLDKGVQLKILDMMSKDGKEPEKMDLETNIDLDALQGILTDEMHNRGISDSIKKIIAVIQNIEGKKIWNLNCVLTGMEVLSSHVEDESKTVLKMDRKSLMDIMKHVPTQAMKQQQQPKTKENAEKQMENLNKLESEIEKEKEKLKEELQDKKSLDSEEKKEESKEDEEEKKKAFEKEKAEAESKEQTEEKKEE